MANEKRLIDAKTLAEKVYALTLYVIGMRNGKTILKENMEKYRNAVLREICKAPTVDAVEVVRCKDCKKSFKNMGMCCLRSDGLIHITENDFCSKGERREGE